MATDAFMAFQDYQGNWLASESTVSLANSSETLATPFKAAANAKGLFEITEYSFGLEQTLNITSQSTGTGAGKVTMNPFTITRNIDVSSPKFFINACVGTPFKQVLLGVRKASGGLGAGQSSLNVSGSFFLLFTFAMVAVKTINWSHGDESPTESLEFGYGAMQMQYSQQASDGSLGTPIPASWNQMTNAPDMPS